jgi:hypothetical protein
MCSRGNRAHFGIPKKAYTFVTNSYLTVISCKYKLILYSLTIILDLSVGNMVVCFRLLVCLLCADLAGMCPASVGLLLVRLFGSVHVYDDMPLGILME